jgi:hypothetical protein
MKPSVSKRSVLADSFLFGNLLKTTGEMYSLDVRVQVRDLSGDFDNELYSSTCEKKEEFKLLRKIEREDIFLKPSDVISSIGKRETLYVSLTTLRPFTLDFSK